MSLFKKLKDVLFEEEEYTEPIKIRDEKKEEVPVRVTPRVEVPSYKEEKEGIPEPVMPKSSVPENKEENIREIRRESERELFKKENTFEFPSFDEEEFQSSMRKPKPTNVLEYERKKTIETRTDNGRYVVEKEYTEKKKFKPSPIISPVYGILNQDYKAEDIVDKTENNKIDFETVRKKAFEEPVIKKEEIKVKKEEKLETPDPISEPVVTFFEEKDNIKVDGLDINEAKKDYKTINDLLEEASEEIPLEDTLDLKANNNLDVIEEELEKMEEEKVNNNELEEDLDNLKDNELFELIDSMYEDREEG